MPIKATLQQRVSARKDISDEEALSGTEERSTASGTESAPEVDPSEEDFVDPEGRSSHREVTILLVFCNEPPNPPSHPPNLLLLLPRHLMTLQLFPSVPSPALKKLLENANAQHQNLPPQPSAHTLRTRTKYHTLKAASPPCPPAPQNTPPQRYPPNMPSPAAGKSSTSLKS